MTVKDWDALRDILIEAEDRIQRHVDALDLSSVSQINAMERCTEIQNRLGDLIDMMGPTAR